MVEQELSIINVEDEYSRSRFGRLLCEGSDWKTPIFLDAGGIKNERVMASPIIDLDFYNADRTSDDDGVVILDDPIVLKKAASVRSKSRKRNIRKLSIASPPIVIEIGESSDQSTSSRSSSDEEKKPETVFCCTICFEPKSVSETFTLMTGCSHTFCADCIEQYIASKIQANTPKITCPNPDCKDGYLKPENCHSILPPDVFERWCATLCEALLFGSSAFYCPFKDCSAPLLNEVEEGSGDASSSNHLQSIRESECPHCSRLFCASCKVPWHAGFSCEEFQKLGDNERSQEDLSLLKMAKKMKWQRCPKCKVVVDRIDGCMFMKCRCGFTFCYGCGTEMVINHYCKKCNR